MNMRKTIEYPPPTTLKRVETIQLYPNPSPEGLYVIQMGQICHYIYYNTRTFEDLWPALRMLKIQPQFGLVDASIQPLMHTQEASARLDYLTAELEHLLLNQLCQKVRPGLLMAGSQYIDASGNLTNSSAQVFSKLKPSFKALRRVSQYTIVPHQLDELLATDIKHIDVLTQSNRAPLMKRHKPLICSRYTQALNQVTLDCIVRNHSNQGDYILELDTQNDTLFNLCRDTRRQAILTCQSLATFAIIKAKARLQGGSLRLLTH